MKVFATLRRPKVVSRKVLSPDTVCVDARTISPLPDGVAHFVPVASEESAVRTCPLVPTAGSEKYCGLFTITLVAGMLQVYNGQAERVALNLHMFTTLNDVQ